MTKTEFMLIGSRQKLNSLSAIPALEINVTQLNTVNFTKSLGVLLDQNSYMEQSYQGYNQKKSLLVLDLSNE